MVGLKAIPNHCPPSQQHTTSLQNHLLLFHNFKIVKCTMHLKKPMKGFIQIFKKTKQNKMKFQAIQKCK